jgi:arsenate reductase (thioredoxin)
VCPIWPGRPLTAHWGVPDPAAVQGSDDDKRKAFDAAFATLDRRIGLFLGLPIGGVDKATLSRQFAEIGQA